MGTKFVDDEAIKYLNRDISIWKTSDGREYPVSGDSVNVPQSDISTLPIEDQREADAKLYGYPGGLVTVTPDGKLIAKGGLTKGDKQYLWSKGVDPLFNDQLNTNGDK